MKNLIKYILIFISVLISTTRAEELVYAQVGENVILKPLNSQKHYLYWKFGEANLAWRNPMGGNGFENVDTFKNKLSWSGDSLLITEIQQQHFGTFTCTVGDNHLVYHLLRLNVNTSAHSLLLPGESLYLSCDADAPQGHKAPVIYWVNPQKTKISNDGKITRKAKSQDDGQWTCVVKNGKKEHNTTVRVTVLGLSSAPSNPLYMSKWSSIPCSIPSHISWNQIRAKGIQEVYWKFSPKPAVISDNAERLFFLSLDDPLSWRENKSRGLKPTLNLQKGNLSLIKKQWKEDDRGHYVCGMKFQNGDPVESIVHVEVLKIIASPGKDLISGQQVNLTCSLGHQLPSDVQVEWTPPGQSSLKFDIHLPHFTIPEVGTGDSGNWECALWRGKTKLTFDVITLTINPRLSAWMLVTICSAAVIVILVLIVVFILYRRRQRKMRHLRHRLCQCKNPKPKGFYRT